MSWTIAGSTRDILVGVSSRGNVVIHGEAPHAPYITEDDWVSPEYPAMAEALRRLQRVKAEWLILSSDAVETEIIDHVALLKRTASTPESSIAQISCIDPMDDSAPALSFTVALHPQTFKIVYDLFSKLITGPGDIEYTISVGFMTLGFSSATIDMPTLQEFQTGTPYFSDEVSFSVRHARR